jgi:hypothetical protein
MLMIKILFQFEIISILKLQETLYQELCLSVEYRVFFALAFSAQSVGQTTAYLQDYTRARLAAEELFCLIDRCPEMVKGTAKPVS